ncbi:MAG: hypothetical protein Q7R33_05050 [Nitrosarchaeum sp.]|nr:hypothetical protein [Nitrosarchaeum sp.]
MANKLFVAQRTRRHVVKRLSAASMPATYDGTSFGTYTIPGTSVVALNFPWGCTVDAANYVFVCDTANHRIVKLDSSLVYDSHYDTTATVGTPYAIFYDASTTDLYVVGIDLATNNYLKIQRLTTAFLSVKLSGNLNTIKDIWFKPTSICRGFLPNTILVSGANLDLFSTTESGTFSSFVQVPIVGETTTYPDLYATTQYFGMTQHSDGNLYLNNGRKILKVNSSYVNIGDSDVISKTLWGLRESAIDNSLLIYNVDDMKIQRYDTDLNFVEDVYANSGSSIGTSAYDIMDFAELSV